MGKAEHGRKARILLDCSGTPGSGDLSIVSMLVNWSTDQSVEFIDTTSCDDENNTSVAGLKNYKGTFDTNMDADSDILYAAADGQARLHYLYPNREAVAGKKRYNYGEIRLSLSESGGAKAKNAQSFTFEATGNITRVFV